MIVEEKLFAGVKLNSDDAIEYMAPTDILGGVGVRIHTGEKNKQGLVVTLEGNRELTRPLPVGTNEIIRAREFPKSGKAYIFTKNSNGNHRIEEFDYTDSTFTTVYTDKVDSGGEQLLDWGNTLYIKDVSLVQGRLLYWTEFPNDTVRRIYVDKAKSGQYGVFRAEDFGLSVLPPGESPIVLYNNDITYDYNNIAGNLFQFRYAYEYDNFEVSSYSPISRRPYPLDEPNSDVLVDFRNNNVLTLWVNGGGERVKRIHISFRIGYGSWYHLKTVDRDYLETLPDEDLNFQTGVREAYRRGWDSYQFAFYNDALYTVEDQLLHDLLADHAPLQSRAMEVVNDNTLLLGNNGYGYDAPVLPDDELYAEVVYRAAGGTPGNFRLVSFDVEFPIGGNSFKAVYAGTPTEGDMMRSTWLPFSGQPVPEYSNYSVSSLTDGDLMATVTAYANSLQSNFGIINTAIAAVGGTVELTFGVNPSNPGQKHVNSMSVSASTPVNDSIATLKLQSSYQVAVAWYDRYERPFRLYTNNNLIVKTDAFANTQGQLPSIRWYVPEFAPPGADRYRICITRNRTHEDTWYFVSKRTTSATAPSSPTVTYGMSLQSMVDFNRENSGSTLAYEFQDGDRINIIGKVDLYGNVTSWINTPIIYNFSIRNVVDTPIGGDPPTSFLKEAIIRVDKNSVFIDIDSDYLVEIYRPKRQSSPEEEVYYELPETYNVVNGRNQDRYGEISAVDCFMRSRYMIFPEASDLGVIPAESFHFSDYYKSDYDNLGRPRTLDDTPSSQRHIAEIRYSREWISGSRVNGINRFYPEDVYDAREPMYGAQETYGGIQYLQDRENRVICVQEIKIGYIPVNRSIIEDLAEQQQMGVSSELLNPINYYAGSNIGIGKDYAIPSFKYANGNCYLIDPVEMVPVRAGLNGTMHIGYKYTGALKAKIREAITNGQYIHSVWDDRMNEWMLMFPDATYVFDEKVDGWAPEKPYLPEAGFTANDRLYTAKSGRLYIHDDEVNRNRFYGTNYDAELIVPVTSPRVKTYQSLALHSSDEIVTKEFGIETQLGQVSELNLPDDYQYKGEGVRYANLLWDINSPGGAVNGDRLKGRWIKIHLHQPAPVTEWNLLKLVVKSALSTPNE